MEQLSFEQLIRDTFQWSDSESSKLGVLFGYTQNQQSVQPGSLNTPFAFTSLPTPGSGAARAAGQQVTSCVTSTPILPLAAVGQLISPFSGLPSKLLPSAAAPNARTAAAGPSVGAPAAASQDDEQQWHLLHQQAIMQQAQQELMLQPQQQQQQQQQQAYQAVVTTQLQAQQQQQQQCGQAQQQQAAKAPGARRGRGRPPKSDGQYSEAYLALKRYRARKRSEVDEMEAELAAKQAQLAALVEENKALKQKHDFLEDTIGWQDRMVAVLSALKLEEQQSAARSGCSGCSAGSTTDVSAVIAAITGDNAQPGTNTAGTSSAAAAGTEYDINNPDWASIVPPNQGHRAKLFSAQELDVPKLLLRYKHYVAAGAAALGQLAAVLQQQRPEQFPPGQPVPPAAVGALLPEEVEAFGVVLPASPFVLGEFLALGNDNRIPPAMPAINLQTGEHQSIEPEIWRVVAAQVTLRPGQFEKLHAAWQLYQASLASVNEERAALMDRLKQALDTCHRTTAAADAAGVGLAEGGVRLGLEMQNPNDAAVMLSDAKLLDDVLNQHEYWELSDAIDANMAREDGVMILFDWALFCMLDMVQLTQVVVCSWPFMPLMGSICAWWMDGAGQQQPPPQQQQQQQQ